MQFQNFDIDGFLRDYWQKKPLLIRNPWVDWVNPIDGDELAGLACEEEVEARLITRKRDRWSVEHGPLAETRLQRTGKDPWTLLVQAVDQHVPQVEALIAPFRFIPDWRIDDVMVSYAVDGGGVGPHFDQYDVFLIQGAGRRRWRLGGLCDAATPLASNEDVRLLTHFEATQDWVLEPGDILYVPPRVAHDGIAIGDGCMTYSVGFRAPSRGDLIEGWSAALIEQASADDRYADPDLQRQDNAGEISSAALDRLHAMVTEALQDRNGFARWFGAYNSAPKYPDMDWSLEEPVEPEDVADALRGGALLCRNPASRFSFYRQDRESVALFVDGACFDCAGEIAMLAESLCAQGRCQVRPSDLASQAAMTLIVALINQGSLALEVEA